MFTLKMSRCIYFIICIIFFKTFSSRVALCLERDGVGSFPGSSPSHSTVGHLYTEQPWRHRIHRTMYVSLTFLRTQCWEVRNGGAEQTEEEWASRPLCAGEDIAAHSWLCCPTTHTDLEPRGARLNQLSKQQKGEAFLESLFSSESFVWKKKKNRPLLFKTRFLKTPCYCPRETGSITHFYSSPRQATGRQWC